MMERRYVNMVLTFKNSYKLNTAVVALLRGSHKPFLSKHSNDTQLNLLFKKKFFFKKYLLESHFSYESNARYFVQIGPLLTPPRLFLCQNSNKIAKKSQRLSLGCYYCFLTSPTPCGFFCTY